MSLRNGALKERSQGLRKNATKEENHLWYDFLSNYPFRFRRQVPVDRFILDFYCAAAKMAIELDGRQHDSSQGIAYDAERTAMLQKYDIKVLRFSNKEINACFSAVCELIDKEVKNRILK